MSLGAQWCFSDLKETNVGEKVEKGGTLWAYSGVVRTPGHSFALVILPVRITHPLRIVGDKV